MEDVFRYIHVKLHYLDTSIQKKCLVWIIYRILNADSLGAGPPCSVQCISTNITSRKGVGGKLRWQELDVIWKGNNFTSDPNAMLKKHLYNTSIVTFQNCYTGIQFVKHWKYLDLISLYSTIGHSSLTMQRHINCRMLELTFY